MASSGVGFTVVIGLLVPFTIYCILFSYEFQATTSATYRIGRDHDIDRTCAPDPPQELPQDFQFAGQRGRDFAILHNNMIFLYGAAFPVLHHTALPTEVIVYGMFYRQLDQARFKCCLLYVENSRLVVKDAQILRQTHICKGIQLLPRSFVCKVYTGSPAGVSIALENSTCSHEPSRYVKPYQPRKQKRHSLVVNIKLVYGLVSSEAIIEWMETYRALGVDKIISYADEGLNPAARRVLEYYSTTGYLDMYHYKMADPGKVHREWRIERKQMFCDVNLIMLDAVLKYAGYEYYSMIDIDEIVLPSRNRSLKELIIP